MSVRITHVRYEDSTKKAHESITAYRYVENGGDLYRWKADMVSYVENGTTAYVGTGSNRVEVGVVDASPKYLRTYADGTWSNNLLSLPTF